MQVEVILVIPFDLGVDVLAFALTDTAKIGPHFIDLLDAVLALGNLTLLSGLRLGRGCCILSTQRLKLSIISQSRRHVRVRRRVNTSQRGVVHQAGQPPAAFRILLVVLKPRVRQLFDVR